MGCSGGRIARLATWVLLCAMAGCRFNSNAAPSAPGHIEPFNFQVAAGKNIYQIEGYLALSHEAERAPALLVLNPSLGNTGRCIRSSSHLTELGIHVACISIPGYGASSGPSRFVGPQAVAAARRALDLLAARADVDSSRLGMWGLSNGAVVAGLVMDSDPRPKAIVLQSGAYDMVSFWPNAPILTKLQILHEVWPSRRVLKRRSVMYHLPPKLDCSVLIIQGARDRNAPVVQARKLEEALRARGAKVQACYLPDGRRLAGVGVERPLEAFLRDNLVAMN